MRRTVGLGIVAVTVVVLAGVAGAQTVGRPDPSSDALAAAARQGRPGTLGGVLDGVLDTAIPPGGLGQSGRQRIGTIQQVTHLLGGRSADRSMTFRYPGSGYVKVRLDRATLRRGGSVTVSNPAGTEVYRYDSSSLRAGRWAMSVTGDTAVVTVSGGAVAIDRIARGFTPAERAAHERAVRQRERQARERAVRERAVRERAVRDGEERERGAGVPGEPLRTGREESVCGGDDKSDAVCYRSSDPVLYLRSKAVVRLLINGSELCTGWRVGKLNRVITNHHCFTDSQSAYNTEVWFNYQCAECGGFEVFQPTKVWGDRVLVTDTVLDLTLFTVADFEHVQRFGYLELETQRPSVAEEVFIPQHPSGDPAMIAARSDEDRSGTCAVADPAYDGYARDSDVSYYCDTEGGSSGSPVLSRRTGRVIALHHFGGCPNSGVRADLIYQRIRSLL